MNFEEERQNLPLTIKELELIQEALALFHMRYMNKLTPKPLKPGEEDKYEGKKQKERERLGFIQETFQYVTLQYNIWTKKLNADVAKSAYGTETPCSSGDEELGRN